MDKHSIKNDMYPSKADAIKAQAAAANGIIVAEVLSGDYSHVTQGMTIDLTGSTSKQFAQIQQSFQNAANATKMTIYLTGKPIDQKTNQFSK